MISKGPHTRDCRDRVSHLTDPIRRITRDQPIPAARVGKTGPVHPISRRSFLALSVTVVAAACSGSDSASTTESTTAPAPTTNEPAAGDTPPAPETALAAPTTTIAPLPTTVPLASDPFALGVTSGDPTSEGFILWTRLIGANDEIAITYEVATDTSFSKVAASGETTTNSTIGHSVHLDVTGLDPDTWYVYRFEAGGFTSPVGQARTAPAADAMPASPLFIAAASCQHYESGYYTAHRDIADAGVDLVAFLGDFIYEGADRVIGAENNPRTHGTPEPTTVEAYRDRYALYLSDPDLQASRASCPWIVTWDDHEVENNHAGNTPQNPADQAGFAARRAAAYQAWWEHMPVRLPQPDGENEYTIYRTIEWGALARIPVLDGRQYRTDQACGDAQLSTEPPCEETFDPARTMLGDTQEAWLYDQLDSSSAVWNVIAQQTIMANSTFNGAVLNYDQWDGYPGQRDRILQHMLDAKTRNPVVLTGDIHFAGVANLRAPGGKQQPIVGAEFVTTSISSDGNVDASLEPIVATLGDILGVELGHRGWTKHTVSPTEWQAEFRIVDDVKVVGSPITVWKTFIIDADVPGVLVAD
jgi:alkaline phosphatase D